MTQFRAAGVTFMPGYPNTLLDLHDRWTEQRRSDLEGLAVVLIRDPNNKHDPNAIEIHVPAVGQMVGHVPAVDAAWLAEKIDAGVVFRAEVVDVVVHPDHTDRPGIEVRVTELVMDEVVL